jgi:hypothetical protein
MFFDIYGLGRRARSSGVTGVQEEAGSAQRKYYKIAKARISDFSRDHEASKEIINKAFDVILKEI